MARGMVGSMSVKELVMLHFKSKGKEGQLVLSLLSPGV